MLSPIQNKSIQLVHLWVYLFEEGVKNNLQFPGENLQDSASTHTGGYSQKYLHERQRLRTWTLMAVLYWMLGVLCVFFHWSRC